MCRPLVCELVPPIPPPQFDRIKVTGSRQINEIKILRKALLGKRSLFKAVLVKPNTPTS